VRRITRLRLSPASERALQKLQSKVDADTAPQARAKKLWDAKTSTKPRKAAFDDVRKKLGTMATGRKRCMYCEDSLGTDIDHFMPKGNCPGAAFVWENYVLACADCNSNQKRTAFPLDTSGSPLLVNPVSVFEDPYDHLAFVPDTGYLAPLSARGTATEQVFGLNRSTELTEGRRDAWLALGRLVDDVGKAHDRRDDASVDRLMAEVKRLSFQSVVHHFVRDVFDGTLHFVSKDHARIVTSTRSRWTWAL